MAVTVNLSKLRQQMGLSQSEFATMWDIPLSTLHHWEHGDRVPTGAALTLLRLIELDPPAMAELVIRLGMAG